MPSFCLRAMRHDRWWGFENRPLPRGNHVTLALAQKIMTTVDRRDILSGFIAAGLFAASTMRASSQAPQPFAHDAVIDRARDLASRPYEQQAGIAPDVLRNLNFDQHRDIRFRQDRALFGDSGANFRLHMFHLGFLYNRSVALNVVRDGAVLPVPYSADLFDYGRNRFEPGLPPNLGFAGFRIHHTLNDPRVFDELVSFIGASYFRVLGRGQKYGLSARGLAIDTALPSGEEFPNFREFWIEQPRGAGADSLIIHALLDSPSLTGAYRFLIVPGVTTVMEVQKTLFLRRAVRKLGVAPLTSMFFYGENQNKPSNDFRPEVHDSDGLLMNNGAGEWIWRPLRNPRQLAVSAFVDENPRGFGLMQRDRSFESYQDLELNYEQRPSYWIEPIGQWGPGVVELVEIPTPDETNDNIVAYWVPRRELRPGPEPLTFRYKLHSVMTITDRAEFHPGGRALATYHKRLMPHEAPEANDPNVRRFLIDFGGGDLSFYQSTPEAITPVISHSAGQMLRAIVHPNPKIRGFRVVFDLRTPANTTVDLRLFLRVGERALTETWIYPWRNEP